MTDQNMKLWESVRTPDPSHTKQFSRGGGFKGTATNAVYLIQRATELWGPMGGAWSVEIVREDMLEGAPMLDKNGAVIGFEKVHVIRINLRHPGGVVPGIGQTTFVGTNKYGPFTDEEAPKKSLTDALTKAMSWLGFAADIHLGLWDDNKYVNEARAMYAEEKAPPRGRSSERSAPAPAAAPTAEGSAPPAPAGLSDKAMENWTNRIKGAPNTEALRRAYEAAVKAARAAGDADAEAKFTQAKDTRKATLAPAQPAPQQEATADQPT